MNRKLIAISTALLASMVLSVASAKTLPGSGGGSNKGNSAPPTPDSTFDQKVVNNNNAVAGTGGTANTGSTVITAPVVSQTSAGTKAVQGLPPAQINKGSYPGVSASGS